MHDCGFTVEIAQRHEPLTAAGGNRDHHDDRSEPEGFDDRTHGERPR
jgi:hypothetical protein